VETAEAAAYFADLGGGGVLSNADTASSNFTGCKLSGFDALPIVTNFGLFFGAFSFAMRP
jgi:hypothetical protein